MKAKPKRRGEVQQEARYPAGDLAVDLVAAHAPHEAIRRGNLCYVMLCYGHGQKLLLPEYV